MKLFTQYNRINIAASIIVFVVGSVVFYFVLRAVLLKQLDESLHTEQTEIVSYVQMHNKLPEVVNAYNQQITYVVTHEPVSGTNYYSDKTREGDGIEMEWMRKLVFGITVAGKNYRVTVTKSQVETEDLLQMVIIVGAGMIALILLAGYVINRMVIKRLWKPFYKTVAEVEQYQLAKQQALQLSVSGVSEFDLLNQQLTKMTDRAQQDYLVVKEFSANAAHEMQTPLAVIRTNTEALMQDEYVLQQHDKSIQTICQSVNRLTRLNHDLLLLARIENNQFPRQQKIELDKIIQQKTTELAELLASKKLRYQGYLEPVQISCNPHLAEVIVNNLLSNAIRYNKEDGIIKIALTPQQMIVSNTSLLPALEKDKISQRFYRHPDTKADGNGLGLSIVKQVCTVTGFTLQYDYQQGLHIFSITF
ncbi:MULTISPECIES: sensor histidine kinase [Niastella]|uniref:histidine kinase n=1 Tax=Niastella soli TaxID=2821487 RepID=A0ABS3Z0T2_9BACT|nr:HAMP domain-containing sensor histidine kinase [Niastella soli]MBO9203765.1 HAMP domain-containing histidine kinase [Niastella soli]